MSVNSPTSALPISLATCNGVLRDPLATGKLGDGNLDKMSWIIGAKDVVSDIQMYLSTGTHPKLPSLPCPEAGRP